MKLRSYLEAHNNEYVTREYYSGAEDCVLTVSFVIPAYNSAESVDACVATIFAQERTDLIKEVVVVNDRSDDDTFFKLQRIRQERPGLVIVANPERRGSAYSRNRGIEKATGDLVCFIDSDILLPPDYMVQHILQHQTDARCITFSLRSNTTGSDDLQFPAQDVSGDFRSKLPIYDHTLQRVPFAFCDSHTLAELCLTCAVTYRRADLEKVKGCPENFKGWGFNDTAIAAKVIALRRSVILMQNATVYHLEHAPRSGGNSKKWAEFASNKKRYQRMLELPLTETFSQQIEALDA